MKLGITIQRNTEVDVKEVSTEGQTIQTVALASTNLAAHLNRCWANAKQAKIDITERLLRCQRQRQGVYDPEILQSISEMGGSDIFLMLTDIKCRAAESWIKDVLRQSSDRPFDLEPAHDPEIPPEVRQSIISLVREEAATIYEQDGKEVHPEVMRKRAMELHDRVLKKLQEEAQLSAGRMAAKIEDQMQNGGWSKAFADFVDDFVTYPTAIMKGPILRRKKRLSWAKNFKPMVVNDFSFEPQRRSPFDIFPSPGSKGVDDGYLIDRHRIQPNELLSYVGAPGFNSEAINQIVLDHANAGQKSWLYGDNERERLEGKSQSQSTLSGEIDVLEFWGPVLGQTLLDWGLKGLDPKKTYEVNAWWYNSIVFKAIINPDPLGRRPYRIASFKNIPEAFWGQSIPEIMRDIQVLCNAAARALVNNMAIASGPQVEVYTDRVPEGAQISKLYPWKIHQTTSDRSGGGQRGVNFFQPDMNAQPLMAVLEKFSRQADEVTGIPNYVYGSTSVGGGGRTASGLSMLMDNAAKGIKESIEEIDRCIADYVEQQMTLNMMYDPDPFIKGDFLVHTKGTLGLVAKEQLAQRRNEFLAITNNPTDMQIIGLDGRAAVLREVAKSLQMTEDIVPKPGEGQLGQFTAHQQQQVMQIVQQTIQQLMSAGQPNAQQPQQPQPAPVQ